MGWGLDFSASLFIKGVEERTLEYDLEECKNDIIESEKSLAMYAVSTPKDIMPTDTENYVLSISYEVSELVDTIRQSAVKLFLIEKYLESKEA